MHNTKHQAKGFTLITTLLLLFLLSGIAIGMLMMVNTEVKVGTQDVQNNQTFHAAEGAIEKMTADLANTFQTTLSPTVADIEGLSALAPTGTYQYSSGTPGWPGATLPVYSLTPVTGAGGGITFNTGVVASGPFAGLNAETMQVNLQATAQGPLGDEVNMARTVEVALIPVFQFGVFSNGDLAFFTNPTLTFNGRIHTNGDLYLGCAGGNTCTFTNKITVYGNIIRANIPNGLGMGAANDAGNVMLPGEPGGCSGAQPACTTLPTAGDLWGSVTGAGGNPPASAYNAGPPAWLTISTNTWSKANPYLGGMVIDGNYGANPNSGATDLEMPFVSGAVAATTPGLGNPPGPQNYEIVRRPPAGELPTSPLGASRMYNEAAIRILLADKPEYLPGGPTDADNVRLANIASTQGNGNNYSLGVQTAQPNLAALGAGHAYTTYFATASALIPNQSSQQAAGSYYADWPFTPATYAGEYDAVDGSLPQLFVGKNAAGTTTAPAYISTTAECSTTTGVCPYPYYVPPTLNVNPTAGVNANNDTQWNLIDGYLRVEFLPNSGVACPGPGAAPDGYCAVTREWLQLGFARGLTPPSVPGFPYTGAAGQNTINPYAILIFQQPAMRNTTGWPAPPALDMNGTAPTCKKAGATYTCTGGTPPEVAYDAFANNPWNGDIANAVPSITAFNWYPVNFYDAREGEPNDTVQPAGNNSCTPLGVMNAVELDVGNLAQWLAGNIGLTGNNVNSTNENGYVLYFSDRRGMLPNPNGTQTIPKNAISGDAGFEDVVNSASATRAPDGALEPAPAGKTISPEDANLNAALDNFGSKNLGLGLGYVPAATQVAAAAYTAANGVNAEIIKPAPAYNPYLTAARMPSCSVAKNAWVSGARHVLKLVDGGMNAAGTSSYLPHQPAPAAFPNWGGFTVGAENPVYIFGNYNTNAADTYWANPSAPKDQAHAAASVIADTVTLLSNNWLDWNSILLQPTQPQGDRVAGTTYYRTAIASGDVQTFSPLPAWAAGNAIFIGTDGGVGNFLRFLEDWSGQTLNYSGSMVDLFFSTYNTGLFKCCNYSVYLPPTRNYNFDVDFNTMSQLPPGTPLFRDIDNLSYRQTLTACTVVNPATGMCSN